MPINNSVRIVITFTPDVVYLEPYILEILKKYNQDFNFVALIKTRSSLNQKKKLLDTFSYNLGLVLILGISATLKNFFKILQAKLTKHNPLESYCASNGIAIKSFDSINSKVCQEFLRKCEPDVVLNQSLDIIKQSVIDIPKIAIINRHGSLLPKYRGRLSPFWQLLHKEKIGGVTYHVVNEMIDKGMTISQEQIEISANDNFNTLVEKIFNVAVEIFGATINKLVRLKNEGYNINENNFNSMDASYFPSPMLKDALKYRLAICNE